MNPDTEHRRVEDKAIDRAVGAGTLRILDLDDTGEEIESKDQEDPKNK
jgi:hypothetical protein